MGSKGANKSFDYNLIKNLTLLFCQEMRLWRQKS